jgi:hypothetical protein
VNAIADLSKYLFDGNPCTPTHDKYWFLIDSMPEKIEKWIPGRNINIRYELKDEFPETATTPRIINTSYIDEDNNYYNVSALYERKYESLPEEYVEVDFEINILDADDDYRPVTIQYPIENTILDRITTHPALLHNKPCKLSREETYKIIRAYVKQNIDKNWAKITSDYDFCFTVKKIIALDEPEGYTVDVANINNFGGRKRKPRIQERYRKDRELTIFEMAPKSYQSYPVVEPFSGVTYEDMVKNINTYLEDLIENINAPLVDCKHCHGLGVLLK